MRLLIAALITSQMMYFPNLSFRWCKELSLQVIIILSLCSLIWQKNKALALFIAWSVAAFFIGKGLIVNEVSGLSKINYNPIALLNVVNYVLFGMFYYILHQMKIDKKMLYNTFCCIAIFSSVYAIIQYFQLGQFFVRVSGNKQNWPVALWGNEALCAWSIALCSPFFLFFKKLRYKLGYIISFIGVCVGKTTAAPVAFILGLLFWLYFKGKRRLALSVFIILLISCIYFFSSGKANYYFNSTHRFKVWNKTVEIWKKAPITGYGLGSFRTHFWAKAPEFRTDGHWAQAHNDYLQTLFELGLPGLLLLLSIMWITFYRFIKTHIEPEAVTSLFILAMISFWGFPGRTAMMIIPIVALVIFEVGYGKKKI